MNHAEKPTRPRGRAARLGLWLLPAYGLLLGYSTLRQQPDVDTQFDAYARYITTPHFLFSHLIASIGGAALAILGVMSALAFLANGPRPRAAVAGSVITVLGNVLATSVFGSAAFTQPGIGRAHLRGMEGIRELNADTAYSSPLMASVGVSVLLLNIGAILLGSAIARQSPELRWAGIAYAAAMPIFSITGILGFFDSILQPASGVVLALATALIAHRLPRSHTADLARKSQVPVA